MKTHPVTQFNPDPWYHEMRNHHPVYYDPDFRFFFGAQGGWLLFAYEDVKQALNDYETYSCEYIPVTENDLLSASIFTMNPPRHKKMRAIVSKAFSLSMVSQMEQWMYNVCHSLIMPFIGDGRMEFVRDFAAGLPNLVMARLIGIPDNYGEKVSQWSKTLTGDPAVLGMDAHYNTMAEMSSFLSQLIQERSLQPQEDLITNLLHAEIDGEKLTITEILAFCVTLLGAGTETSEGWLSIAMYMFSRYPAIQQHLQAVPADIPKALAEVLRLRSPAIGLARIVIRDIQLQGQKIKKGDLVNLFLNAANLDPA
ncbi:cytochrome P450 [Chitinophaga solisilvae]|uniref:cytochrome P450 n=1 Tax=Chitinophaga solisilvae TaxID=1233460 RepID=UPI0013715CD1|nr:cytochrome P450 [Chitinophaga solisilvae]